MFCFQALELLSSTRKKMRKQFATRNCFYRDFLNNSWYFKNLIISCLECSAISSVRTTKKSKKWESRRCYKATLFSLFKTKQSTSFLAYPKINAWKLNHKIAVVSLYANRTNEYQLAMDSLECYCIHEGYPYYRIHTVGNQSYSDICPHKNVRLS